MELEKKLSLTGVIAVVMLCITMLSGLTAMVGGWYSFSSRIKQEEDRTKALEDEHRADTEAISRLNDTLDRTNAVLYGVEQALDDNHIHVRPTE